MTVTTPCPDCNAPTVIAQDAAGRRIVLDASVPVWCEEFDPEERVRFYARSTGAVCLVEHRWVCKGKP